MARTIRYLEFQVPIKTVSEANQREHWAVKNKRKKWQQLEMSVALQNNLRGRKVEFPCTVKLTRVAPKMLDVDNLASSFKATQDAVSAKLGIDDGDVSKVTWVYDQKPIGIHHYAVTVEIKTN